MTRALRLDRKRLLQDAFVSVGASHLLPQNWLMWSLPSLAYTFGSFMSHLSSALRCYQCHSSLESRMTLESRISEMRLSSSKLVWFLQRNTPSPFVRHICPPQLTCCRHTGCEGPAAPAWLLKVKSMGLSCLQIEPGFSCILLPLPWFVPLCQPNFICNPRPHRASVKLDRKTHPNHLAQVTQFMVSTCAKYSEPSALEVFVSGPLPSIQVPKSLL